MPMTLVLLTVFETSVAIAIGFVLGRVWDSATERPAVSAHFFAWCCSIALFNGQTTLDHGPQPAERVG
jgi:hypothetical protein